MSKFFEDVFVGFKETLNESLSEIIAVTGKYSPGKYQINLFVSYGYWINSENMENDLNCLMTFGLGKFLAQHGLS